MGSKGEISAPTGDVNNTRDINQITFELSSKSILYWRRSLLIRYLLGLGKDANADIKWSDYDKKNGPIALEDEKRPFLEKMPSNMLARTTIQINYGKKKILTITLYYASFLCLVQGTFCQTWVQGEFDKIKKTVDKCLKGDNPKSKIDQLIQKLPKPELPTENLIDLDETDLKGVFDDSDLDLSTTFPKEVISQERVPNSPAPLTGHDGKNKGKSTKNENDPVTTNLNPNNDAIIDAIHKIENKIIECHTEYNDKIEKLTQAVDDLKKMVSKQDQNIASVKTEIEKTNKEVSKNITSVKAEVEKTNERLTRNIDHEIKRSEKVDRAINMVQQNKDIMENVQVLVNEKQINQVLVQHEKEGEKIQHQEETREDRQNLQTEYEYDFCLVGTSLVKDIDSKQMYRYKRTRVTVLRDKTVRGANEFLETGKLNGAKVICYQVGSNDLENKDADEVCREIQQLALKTKSGIPGCEVVLSEILPRYYNNNYESRAFESKRLVANEMLENFCEDAEIKMIKHQNITQIHLIDGIHLRRKSGTGQYVRNLKSVINPIIGVKSQETTDPNNFRSRYQNGNRGFQNRGSFKPLNQQPAEYGSRYRSTYYPPNQGQGFNRLDQSGRRDVNVRLLRIALGLE